MNARRGHESQRHLDAKRHIGQIFDAPRWSVFYELHQADILVINHDSHVLIAIEAESTPRNVIRNITRNFQNGCDAVATVALNERYHSQIQTKIQTYVPDESQRHVKLFGYDEESLRELRFWILHICQIQTARKAT